jgi:hypothetical protein
LKKPGKRRKNNMEITIKIIVPVKNNPWKLSIGRSTGKHFSAASSLYTKVEQFLMAKVKEKNLAINIKVDYCLLHPKDPEGWVNEGQYNNVRMALYSLASFLEDYIGNTTLTSKFAKYSPEI